MQQHGSGTQEAFGLQIASAVDFRNIEAQLALEVPTIVPTASQWLEFKKISMQLMVKNCTNVALHMTCYKWVQRKDTTNQVGSPTEFISTPAAAFTQGLVNQGMAAAFYQAVGVTPFESNDFTRLFKITQVKKKVVPVNRYITLRALHKNLRVGPNDYRDTDVVGIARKTTGWFVVVSGMPVLVTGGAAANTSFGKIAAISIEKYVLRNLPDYLSDKQISFVSVAQPVTAGVFINDQVIVNTAIAVSA